MSVFLLSVSLNQLTSIIFLLEKAKKERKRKTAKHLCREREREKEKKRRKKKKKKKKIKEEKNEKKNELSQHQVSKYFGFGPTTRPERVTTG